MPITKLRADLAFADGTVTAAKLADGSVTLPKVHNLLAGNGIVKNQLTGGLDLNIDPAALELLSDQLKANANVTLKGNSFNGPSQLVQLQVDGKMPALDGSNLTGLGSLFTGAGATDRLTLWTSTTGLSSSSDLVWLQSSSRLGIKVASPGSELDMSGSVTLRAGSAPALSSPGSARIYFDSGTGSLKLSENGGAYVDMAGGGNFVDLVAPSGSLDGINVVFTLSNTPILGSVHLYMNGLLLRPGAGNDFTISGATITMASAPAAGYVLLASYRF